LSYLPIRFLVHPLDPRVLNDVVSSLQLKPSVLVKAERVPRLWSDQRRKKHGQSGNPYTSPDHKPFGLILKRRTLFLCYLQNACFASYSAQ